uniref:Uncharacterized protein n=1 Tax=Arundo donax TaxID=35708 RepID=A0A0A9GS00_ARUDO
MSNPLNRSNAFASSNNCTNQHHTTIFEFQQSLIS